MPASPIAFIATPTDAAEAKGVHIKRSIGSDRLVFLDPLLLMDHLTLLPEEGGEAVGFPRHPHRGIETLTYVFKGHVRHRDSLGNMSTVGPGGSQWMTAGDGIWHEEMLVPDETGTEALQVWFSLPRDQKRVAASYQPATAEQPPEVALDGAVARVVCGEFAGQKGPVDGIAVNPLYVVFQISENGKVEAPVNPDWLTVAYVVNGRVRVDGRIVGAGHLVIFRAGDSVAMTSEAGATVVLISAAPLNEPVVQYRSFVMNTVEDIAETLDQLHTDSFAAGQVGFS